LKHTHTQLCELRTSKKARQEIKGVFGDDGGCCFFVAHRYVLLLLLMALPMKKSVSKRVFSVITRHKTEKIFALEQMNVSCVCHTRKRAESNLLMQHQIAISTM
jgi:hypothetical protein